MKKTLSLLFLTASIMACKKQSSVNDPLINKLSTYSIRESKLYVAKTLAAAVTGEPTLRQFLKDQALKQFDNDYDVFYQSVKNQQLADGETVHAKLERYASSKDSLNTSLVTLPLLTILVPELGEINAVNWDATTEIPIVAVEPESYGAHEHVQAFYGKSGKFVIPYGSVPGSTTLVVKDNDRVIVKDQNVTYGKSASKNSIMSVSDISGNNSSDTFLSTDGMSFSFADPVFNNKLAVSKDKPMVMSRDRGDGTGDVYQSFTSPVASVQHIIDAINSGDEWQRDFIYYGLSANAGIVQGPLKSNMRECVTHMRVTNPAATWPNIGNNPNDPQPVDNTTIYQEWTNGSYEFRLTALVNSKNGSGAQINKTFFVKPSDLFLLGYKSGGHVVGDGGGQPPLRTPYIKEALVYTFPTPLPLIGWNLENVSSGWSIMLTKYNNQVITTQTITTSNKYATNFEFSPSLGENVKTGLKFGGSLETTNTSTYVVATTFGPLDFGSAVLNYGDPIIVPKHLVLFQNSAIYEPYELLLGAINLTVQPRPVF